MKHTSSSATTFTGDNLNGEGFTMITQERLRQVLSYNSETGIFLRVSNKTRTDLVGKTSGSKNSNGYLVVEVDGKKYYAHRIAWLYEYGVYPTSLIDHINQDRLDNRIDNLRISSKSKNSINSGNYLSNTSGVRGVCWDKNQNTWLVSITYEKKSFYVGRFLRLDEAVFHRLAAEQCLEWDSLINQSPAKLTADKILHRESI